MNTYAKYCPNVFVAKCEEQHEKGEEIILTTKYGKEHECIVFNLVAQKDGFYYYSIVRADGYNVQERAARKAEKYNTWAASAENKSNEYYNKSHDLVKHIPLGQPILVGHHSENHHRRTLDKSWNAMGKSVEMSDKAAAHERKAEYWERKIEDINLSMPESVQYYEQALEKAKEYHEGLKSGKYPREHSFSLTYAKKKVNELESNLETAKKLWS